MVQSFLNGLLYFFLFLIKLIATIFIYPIQAVLVSLFPSVGDFLSSISLFFTTKLFPLLSFLRNVFLNVSCCPVELYSLLVTSFFGLLSIALTLRVFMLIYRIYLIIRGAKA